MPRVTVLTVVYNGEPYIHEAVASIVAQSYDDFEYLIVDNGSTDTTAQTIESFDDPRIRLIRRSENVRPPVALNAALKEASGERIAILDGDDIAYPHRLERQMAYLDSRPDILLLGCGFQQIDRLGAAIGPACQPPEGPTAVLDTCPHYNPFAHSTVMYRREAALRAGGYPEDIRSAYDYGHWLRLMRLGPAAVLPSVEGAIRIHEAQITRSPDLRFRKQVEYLSLFEASLGHPGMSEEGRRLGREAVADHTSDLAAALAAGGRRREAFRWLALFLWHYPRALARRRSWGQLFTVLTGVYPRQILTRLIERSGRRAAS